VDAFAAAAGFLDATAWDNYVAPPGVSAYEDQYRSGFPSDFARCAGPRQRFLCAEKIAYVPAHVRSEGLRVQAYADLAHGSYGTLYFEWRRPQAGNEQARPSRIVRFDGSIPDRAVFARIGAEFARLGPRLAGATTRADVAMHYDFANEWSQGFWGSGRGYDADAERYYHGFKVLQRNIDVVPPTAELSDNSMRRVLSPGPFAAMAGVTAVSDLSKQENLAMGTLDARLNAELGIVFTGHKTVFAPRTMLEDLRLDGATPVDAFRGGRMAGRIGDGDAGHGEAVIERKLPDSRDRIAVSRTGYDHYRIRACITGDCDRAAVGRVSELGLRRIMPNQAQHDDNAGRYYRLAPHPAVLGR
jgi:Beta-galactosidase